MPKRTKKIIIIIIVSLVALTAAAGFWYAKKRHNAPTQQDASSNTRDVNSVDYSAPNTTNDKTVESDKDKTSKDEQAQNGNSSSGTTPEQQTLGASITAATQDGDMVFIRATANGATSGTCTLTLSKDGATTITRTAVLAAQANYVICQGFNLQTSDFSSAGSWKAIVKIESNGASAQAEKELTIQK